MDILGLLIAIGSGFAWFFTSKNWIISDLICIAIVISVVKVFKFTNLKYATIMVAATLGVELIYVLILFFVLNGSRNNAINEINNVLEFQIPTINPVYNAKCVWVTFMSICYPGALFCYLRRFDQNRGTKN